MAPGQSPSYTNGGASRYKLVVKSRRRLHTKLCWAEAAQGAAAQCPTQGQPGTASRSLLGKSTSRSHTPAQGLTAKNWG